MERERDQLSQADSEGDAALGPGRRRRRRGGERLQLGDGRLADDELVADEHHWKSAALRDVLPAAGDALERVRLEHAAHRREPVEDVGRGRGVAHRDAAHCVVEVARDDEVAGEEAEQAVEVDTCLGSHRRLTLLERAVADRTCDLCSRLRELEDVRRVMDSERDREIAGKRRRGVARRERQLRVGQLGAARIDVVGDL